MPEFSWINLLRNVFEFVANIWFIITIISAIVTKRLITIRKRYHLKQVLSFQKNPKKCFVCIPKYRSVILNRERDIAIFDEVSLMLEINGILSKVGIQTVIPAYGKDDLCDEIQIGGPVSNEFTNRFFQQYLKGIKWIVTKAHLNRYKADPNLKELNYDFIETSKDGKEGFKIGGKFYEYIPQKEGWAIIVKLIDKSSVSPKAIHLLFGCGTNGTIGAVSYFVNYYSDIYKNNKSHPYIGIFKVNGRGDKIGNISYLSDPDKYIKL